MAGQVKIEDSNIALLGGDLDKNARKTAAETEKEWKSAGKARGIEIWRIEKFSVKKWPKEEYGNFYTGDSYIVLHTYKPDPEKDKLAYNIHFWLGAETSQDEAGTAAYKTVELDDFLGTMPVQYREVQGYESDEFEALFKEIKIMSGGMESGFKHVEKANYAARLLQVKGRRENVRVTELKLDVNNVNSGDVFLLDTGERIFQWNGSASGVFEKRKAGEVAETMNQDRNGKVKLTVIEETDDNADSEEFWKIVGGKPAKVRSAAEGGDDAKVEAFTRKLFRISDASGDMKITEAASGSEISWDHIKNEDVFLLDAETMIYIWIGSGASKDEKSKAFQIANQYLSATRRPWTTPVARVVAGAAMHNFDKEFKGVKPNFPAMVSEKAMSNHKAAPGAARNAGASGGCCVIL